MGPLTGSGRRLRTVLPNGTRASAPQSEVPLEVRRALSHESSCMADTTRYEIIGNGQCRVLAPGWWADVRYRWDRATDTWQVAVLDTNAYGRIALADIALAANQAIGMGEVPADKLVWLNTGGRDHRRHGGAMRSRRGSVYRSSTMRSPASNEATIRGHARPTASSNARLLQFPIRIQTSRNAAPGRFARWRKSSSLLISTISADSA